MFIRDVRRSGRWFPESGCSLEHQILRCSYMLLRDRCSTSYDLASVFHGRRNTLDRWSGKFEKGIGTRLSALRSTFHFRTRSCRIASFLMLSTSKIEKSRRISSFWSSDLPFCEDVSQNCFVFGLSAITFEGRLAGLLRFAPANCYFWRKSRTTAAFQIR